MPDYVIVKSKQDLEAAIKSKVNNIVVVNKDLAQNIRIVKAASQATIAIAIVSAGVAVVNFWNPVGWTVGAVGVVATGSTTAAIVALGIGGVFVYAIFSDYTIKASGKVKLPDGTEVSGEVILERN